MNKTLRFPRREILLFTALVLQVALYIFMWFRFLDDPALYGGDFISFYTAGRIVRQGDLQHLYDLDIQRAIQEPIVGVGTFAGGSNLSQHPPYLAPLLAALAVDDFVQAYVWWTLVRLVALALCGFIIHRFLRRAGFDAAAATWVSLGSLAFFPLFLSILGGQDTVFVLLGLLAWTAGLLQQGEIRAGLGLAFATLNPTIAGALAVPMLAARRRAGAWFLAGMAALGLYSLALVGLQGAHDFIGLLTLSAGGSEYGLNPHMMYNVVGLLVRAFPGLELALIRGIGWGFTAASLLGVCLLWWGRDGRLRGGHIGIAVVLAVFTSPHLHIHSLAYLVLPGLAASLLFWQRGWKTVALFVLPATSIIIMLLAFPSGPWIYLFVYLWMLAAAVFFAFSLNAKGDTA